MGKVKQYKRTIGHFLSSEKGQRFFNFAYSIGAAIVIWGALFKILHLPGGNTLLSIGMGTEVLMFLLSAFDKPAKDYKWEKVYPGLNKDDDEVEVTDDDDTSLADQGIAHGGGVIYVGGAPAGVGATVAANMPQSGVVAAAGEAQPSLDVTDATARYLEQMTRMTEEMSRLRETTEALNRVSDVLLQSYQVITANSESITRSSQGYVDQMADLSRNLTGLNTIYEIQLKSVSSQIDSIDRVNRGIKDIRDMYEKSASQSARYCEETERMAHYMHQLNTVYEKMLHAMTINMYNPMMGGAAAAAQQPAQGDTQTPPPHASNL